jgi:hypothetical protein
MNPRFPPLIGFGRTVNRGPLTKNPSKIQALIRSPVLTAAAPARSVVSEEDQMIWQDVLDEVAAGRTAGLSCPFCRKGSIAVEQLPDRMRLECPACRRFIEGRMGE